MTRIRWAVLAGFVFGFGILPSAVVAAGNTTATPNIIPAHTMTLAQKASYVRSMGLKPSTADACFWADASQTLYIRVDIAMGTIHNHTTWCGTLTGGITPGSVVVQGSLHTISSASSTAHVVMVGYPLGYKASRRHTCVLGQIDYSYLGQSGSGNVSGRIAILMDQGPAIYTGDTVTCLSNISTGTF